MTRIKETAKGLMLRLGANKNLYLSLVTSKRDPNQKWLCLKDAKYIFNPEDGRFDVVFGEELVSFLDKQQVETLFNWLMQQYNKM